ncbi:MAG: chromosome segregation protein SMC [Atopobiaceae bacterium]|nr:chromosome segregation protein SMC [Atopobiaceae bacterium]
MYLKSLTLRGFKSFADKTTLVFDPGLTVVVGPNGSGKSNISDAILWVLGEQSAKMLRGSAMEDVIFSGSSARGSVSMAEVTLVLDNSDGTLPVDYSEVAVTRRMYRSGESEYLINGAASRLMDVTDILHDSGLGREMHSIISQGNLDSILSSRPEERRELIEEAAGISKHRRRKARSERKLKSMDENLTRAKDVSREITRQLRPLERQVGKARQARELQDRLRELSLSLAVDDVRTLQTRHTSLMARSREAEASASLAKLRLQEKSEELERYQSLLEEKGIFVGDLGAQRTRLADQLARLRADERLLKEKGRNMRARIADLESGVASSKRDCEKAREELTSVESELGDARAKWDELKRQVDELVPVARKAKAQRKEQGRQLAQLQAEQRAAQRSADQETLAYAKLRDQVGNAEVEDGLFASRLAQLDEQASTCEERLSERERRHKELTSALDEAKASIDSSSAEERRLGDVLREARGAERRAREALEGQRASLSALVKVDEQAERTSPLVKTLLNNRSVASLVSCRLADVIEAPEKYEEAIERLLGDDLAGLVVNCTSDATQIARAARAAKKTNGTVTLVSRDVASTTHAPREGASPLAESIVAHEDAQGVVDALLGGVYVVGTTEEALRAHQEDPAHTYVSNEGSYVLPDGRIVVGERSGAERGALERKRSIRAAREALPALERDLNNASERVTACERDLSNVRDVAARARQERARLTGEISSIESERKRLRGQLNSTQNERQRVERQRAEAASKAEKARQAIERHRRAADEAAARAEEAAAQAEEAAARRNEASRAEDDAERKVSSARLRLATVQERKNNLIMRSDDLRSRVTRLERSAENAERDVHELRAKILRVKPLEETYAAIIARVLEWAARIEDRASLAEADSAELKQTIGDARKGVDEARNDLDRSQSKVNEIRVEQGRLEVQVESAVGALEEMGANLAEALQLPAPEDREAYEVEVDELKRRLRALGPVNEVAMDEYARLKQRADYITEQVADLESARKSLAKITAAIERRMRRQFLVIFDQVNANFTEVFSLLFPGGQAHLEMTDPDHIFETGIEIIAQPRGKKIQKMMLMSGGEKSLTALALLFAVYRTRTVPFYVFDEVEAALDDSNLGKLLDAIEELHKTTQLIVISHQRRTMEQADVLYGVSMQADGVSHVVSQRLDKSGKVVDA